MNTRISTFPTVILLINLLFWQTSASAQQTNAVAPTLHFGVLSIAPPSRIYKQWQAFIDYVSEKMAQPLSIVVPRGFEKMQKAATNGEVDFFYINSHVLYRLTQDGKAVGILQMKNISGEVTSQSEIFVRKDSDIQTIAQLKGRDIAYVSPMGAGGYLAPKALLRSQGINSGVEVKEKFTKNLSTSIHNVLLKDSSSGAMCGVNFDLMRKKMNMGELRILAVSDPYPEHVIAARTSLDKITVEKFKNVVSNMKNDPAGRQILIDMSNMKISDFIPYDPRIEKITKRLMRQAGLVH